MKDSLVGPLWFDGETYEAPFDRERLGKQAKAVYDLMRDGKWRTLEEIGHATGYSRSMPAISARLRDLRKERFGGFEVLRRRSGEAKAGLHEYKLMMEENQ
jgi:hypothetical protein